jgi:ferredoxin
MEEKLKKVEHLILLVGGNPLPNAVAGELLVNPGGTITLIHSSDTFDIAKRLYRRFKNKTNVKLKEVKESNPASIIQGVRECLEEAQSRTVGLNYTGGTKVMAVHAYRAVAQWGTKKGVTPVFSYLDARKLEMVFDPINAGNSEQRVYIGRALKMNLEDLLLLHNWTLRQSQGQPDLPKSSHALATLFAGNKDMLNKWKDWVGDSQNPHEPHDMPEEFEIDNDKIKNILIKEIQQKGKPKDWMGWLKGKWLEDFVMHSLIDANSEFSLGLHEIKYRIIVQGITHFEIDVIALRGFQMFALSCSTASFNPEKKKETKQELKLKLFETYVRAQQLGGDEARVALVGFVDDPNSLEQEMQRDVDPAGRIKVFGWRQLSDLKLHLYNWIRSQAGNDPDLSNKE